MNAEFLARLLTPSPIMHWLLMTLPMTITLSGLFGLAERETGNRRLSLWAAAMVVWLFLPVSPADPTLRQIGGIRILTRGDGALCALFENRYRLQRLMSDEPELTLEPIIADASTF